MESVNSYRNQMKVGWEVVREALVGPTHLGHSEGESLFWRKEESIPHLVLGWAYRPPQPAQVRMAPLLKNDLGWSRLALNGKKSKFYYNLLREEDGTGKGNSCENKWREKGAMFLRPKV